MGNQMSVPLRTEEQENDLEADSYKVVSDNECVQNGNPVMVSTHVIQHYEEVDLGISISRDNVATSSPKTMEAHAVADASGKNLGKEAKPEAPAARSRFFLTLSRPVPGRPGDQGTDSSAASGRLDVSPGTAPVNKDPSEHRALPMAAAPGPAADKTPGCTEAKQQALPATCLPAPSPPESRAEAPSRPKDFSFLNRFFKLDRGRESAPVERQPEEAKGVEDRVQATEAPAVPGNSQAVPAGEDIVDSKERGQEIDTVRYSVPGDPEVLGPVKEDPQVVDTTENNSPIMSFFKTLVSPNKTETKKDPENTDTENSPATSANVKSDKVSFAPQETQGASKSSKGCSPPGHVPPAKASDTTKEGGKEKSGPTSSPLGKLFWKKTSNSPEKTPSPPEPEPVGTAQKGKETSSKDKKSVDKKSVAETKQKSSKQDAREPAQGAQQPTVESNSLQNGDKTPKRSERRRQSLGGFLKGLGPKRMLDAQVQTDPVTIGPVGKSK
ncbi:breast carcinoma-amplified sequence 1 isoform X5 [Meriones unguiculatus]|uniref:breast carcinoma-amplified sequence 1 isoform X5 n=1 Tax=Meriones unguiculatus TaxID=10047 RepID=UPI00293EBF2A|nr:breast carcinoma-amplified sequence 1 isoform X5 [Meriones unguiculatus]